jgi:hypothetical protein
VKIRKLQNRNNPDIINIRRKVNRLIKYEVVKKVYHTIFKWLGIIVTDREQFWGAIANDWEIDQLDQYEIGFEEIFEQVVKGKRFT